jgi:hypothetical protein
MMLLIAFFALGFTAWRDGSNWWAMTFRTMRYCGLFVSFLGVFSERGQKRVFWAGFALFGWGCFFVESSGGQAIGDIAFSWLYFAAYADFSDPEFSTRAEIWKFSVAFVTSCIGGILSRALYLRSRRLRGSSEVHNP